MQIYRWKCWGMWSRGPLPSTTDTVCVFVCVCLLRLCSAARQSRNLTGSGSSAENNTCPPSGAGDPAAGGDPHHGGHQEGHRRGWEGVGGGREAGGQQEKRPDGKCFLLGWLTFSFRLGPTCTVHQRGKTEATVRHQIKPSLISMQFKVLSCPEVNAKQLYRLTSLGAGPPEAAARPTGEECWRFEGWERILKSWN